MKLNIRALLLFLLLSVFVLSIDPPELPESFQINFNEQVTRNGVNYYMNGQMFYDSINNR